MRFASLLGALALGLVLGTASAGESGLRIERAQPETQRLPELEIQAKSTRAAGGRTFALLTGKFKSQDWSLLYNTKPINVAPDGQFNFEALLNGSNTQIELVAVSVEGNIHTERMEVVAPEAEELKGDVSADRPWDPWETLESRYLAGSVRLPKISFTWSKSDGTKLDWPVAGRWRFIHDAAHPQGTPALTVWARVPDPIVVKEIRPAWGPPVARNPVDSPLSSGRGVSFSFNLDRASTDVSVMVAEGRGLQTYKLRVVIEAKTQFYWLDASCAGAGIEIGQLRPGGRFLFGAARCEVGPEGVDVALFVSPDGVIKRSSINEKFADAPASWRLRVRRPDRSFSGRLTVGTFEMAPKGQERDQASLFVVGFENSGGPRSALRFSFGAGYTSVKYEETPGNVQISESGVTGKLNLVYELVPGKFDLSGNFFVTLANLAHTPATLEAARFYGLNGRVGYRLPINWFRLDWQIHAGVYFVGMIVPGNRYGLQALSGPQALFSLRKELNGKSHSVYVKYAPVNDRALVPSFSSAETAAGLALQIFGRSRPVHLTGDFSNMTFNSVEDGNTAKWTTLTVGLQISL